MTDKKKRVKKGARLLSDSRGIYGLGFGNRGSEELEIVYRPDRISDPHRCVALQGINARIDGHLDTDEFELFALELTERLRLEQLEISTPEAAEIRTRALNYVNDLIGQALKSADQNALRQARRFSVDFRYELYFACCRDAVALEITKKYPFLAFKLYTNFTYPDELVRINRLREVVSAYESPIDVIEIAGFLGIPPACRKVSPQAAVALARLIEVARTRGFTQS